MRGRDRGESRAASPLELLYDLTFVAAFGVAGSELAHGMLDDSVDVFAVAIADPERHLQRVQWQLGGHADESVAKRASDTLEYVRLIARDSVHYPMH